MYHVISVECAVAYHVAILVNHFGVTLQRIRRRELPMDRCITYGDTAPRGLSHAEIALCRRIGESARRIRKAAWGHVGPPEDTRCRSVASLVLQHNVEECCVGANRAREHAAGLGAIHQLDYRVSEGHVVLGGVADARTCIHPEV